MLKIGVTVNNRRTLFLGLDRNNTDRLHRDQPIPVDIQALAQGGDLDGPFQDVVLVAGETLSEIATTLDRYIPGVLDRYRSTTYSFEDDVNPICGCHRRAKCLGCGTCTSCDGCYCGED